LPPDESRAPADHDPSPLSPEALVIQQETVKQVHQALERLPVEFREAIVLRELEGLAYKEIAVVTAVPIGTVMSRLARGRERLLAILAADVDVKEEVRS